MKEARGRCQREASRGSMTRSLPARAPKPLLAVSVPLLLLVACSSPPAPAPPVVLPPNLATLSPAPSSARALSPVVTGTGPSAAGASATARPGTYIVKAGDTLFSIASAQGVPVSALVAANPTVTPQNLQIGQQLVLPSATPATAAPPATQAAGRPAPVSPSATSMP